VNRVLVTGASGFVGRALVSDFAAAGYSVRAAMRQPADIFARGVEVVAVSDLTRPIEWRNLLKGMDTVVHLAGIAHAGAPIPEGVYDRVNRVATAELAAAAKQAGIGRLIFASSIRAQSHSAADHILTEADEPNPTDAYGRSKLAAENEIRSSGVAFTILRPVLVYGANAKGNLATLTRWALTPWPLPLASFKNRRSIIGRDNLISAVHFVLAHETTVGQTYIAADPMPWTVAEIIATLRAAVGRYPALFSVPPALFGSVLKALHRSDLWDRLGGELVASPAKLMNAGWAPPVETRDGLASMIQAASPRKSGTASRSTR
jgi:UDP-glucose 4-epimerase